jgi:Zn-dependent peptidase ImmA (M78 family)
MPYLSSDEQDARVRQAVQNLYRERDIPPPSSLYPIAPLGPLLDDLPIRWTELVPLTARIALEYLREHGSVAAASNDIFAESTDLDTKLAGFLYAGGRSAHIFLNAGDPVVRRRFSLAHEVGHFLLHFRPLLGIEGIAEGMTDAFTKADGEDADTFDQREYEADQFAVELLMPDDVVKLLVADFRRGGFSGRGLAERMAMTFLVSTAAMERRLRGLNLLTVADLVRVPKEARV